MADIKTSIIIDLKGNIERQAARFSGAIGRFATTGMRRMQAFNRVVGSGLDSLGARYAALITGAAGAGTARYLINLQERFTNLGIQANISNEEISKLKSQIFEIARLPNVRIDPSELTAAVEDIIEKTGDLKFAKDNLENFAVAISATGGRSGSAIGQISAEFQKMGLVSKKEVGEALDILTVQGKEGAFTLNNLAQLGSRVVTAYTAMGRTGVPAIREMGAALQVIRQGTGSSEMAATAFEALLRTLGNAQKVKLLQKNGIKIFDEKAAKEGREVLRALPSIMQDIIRQTKGRKTLLSQVFDEEAIRAFNSAAAEFNRTGGFASLEKFMSVQADGTMLLKDSARAAHDSGRALRNLYTAWQAFSDREFAAPLQKAADILNSLDEATVDRWIKISSIGVGILGTAAIGRKIYTGGRAIMSLAGVGGAGVAGGVAAGSVALGLYGGDMMNTGIGWAAGKLSGGKYSGPKAIENFVYDKMSGILHPRSTSVQAPKGSIDIKVSYDKPPKITGLKSSGIDLDVSTGLTMMTAY